MNKQKVKLMFKQRDHQDDRGRSKAEYRILKIFDPYQSGALLLGDDQILKFGTYIPTSEAKLQQVSDSEQRVPFGSGGII